MIASYIASELMKSREHRARRAMWKVLTKLFGVEMEGLVGVEGDGCAEMVNKRGVWRKARQILIRSSGIRCGKRVNVFIVNFGSDVGGECSCGGVGRFVLSLPVSPCQESARAKTTWHLLTSEITWMVYLI